MLGVIGSDVVLEFKKAFGARLENSGMWVNLRVRLSRMSNIVLSRTVVVNLLYLAAFRLQTTQL